MLLKKRAALDFGGKASHEKSIGRRNGHIAIAGDEIMRRGRPPVGVIYPKVFGMRLRDATHSFVSETAHSMSIPPGVLGRRLLEYAVSQFKKDPNIIEV